MRVSPKQIHDAIENLKDRRGPTTSMLALTELLGDHDVGDDQTKILVTPDVLIPVLEAEFELMG